MLFNFVPYVFEGLYLITHFTSFPFLSLFKPSCITESFLGTEEVLYARTNTDTIHFNKNICI